MAKPYYKLRFALGEAGWINETIAKELGRSYGYVATRLCGKASWSVEDAYKLLELIDVPHSEFCEYFPPNGVAVKKFKVAK